MTDDLTGMSNESKEFNARANRGRWDDEDYDFDDGYYFDKRPNYQVPVKNPVKFGYETSNKFFLNQYKRVFTEANPYGGWVTPNGDLVKTLHYSGHYDLAKKMLLELGYTVEEIRKLGYNGVYLEMFSLSYLRILFMNDITQYELEYDEEFITDSHKYWIENAALIEKTIRVQPVGGGFAYPLYGEYENFDDYYNAKYGNKALQPSSGVIQITDEELRRIEEIEQNGFNDAQIEVHEEYQEQKLNGFRKLWNNLFK